MKLTSVLDVNDVSFVEGWENNFEESTPECSPTRRSWNLEDDMTQMLERRVQ